MSTIKVTNLQNASAASPAIVLDANSRATLNGLSYPTEGSLSGRNRIINGDMRIDQRNAGASVTVNTTANTFTLDRWAGYGQVTDGVFTVQQSTSTPPTGFTHFLRVTTTTADASIGASQSYGLRHVIEGNNVSDLGFGTANAKQITLSFWVRSSLTGTFSGSLANDANSRFYVFSFSISAANTWEYKTITLTGDTSGTWETGTSAGIKMFVSLGAGSTVSGTAGSWGSTAYYGVTSGVNVIGTLNATFDITGVQLEAGSVATPFERRSYGQELALCQRYCQVLGNNTGSGGSVMAFGLGGNTTTALLFYSPPAYFRSTPSLSSYSSVCIDDTNGTINISNLVLDSASSNPGSVRLNATATGLSQFRPYYLRGTSAAGTVVLSSEL